MIEPKKYKFEKGVPAETMIKSGFRLRGSHFSYRTTLYEYDNTKQPYVEMNIWIENGVHMTIEVFCNTGIYIPFYNPNMRHDNLVYEKIVSNYNNIMDRFCKKKILKHDRRKHGED